MTPKAQQLGTYTVITSADSQYDQKRSQEHQRSPSNGSEILAPTDRNSNSLASLLLYSLSSRVTSVISPGIVFLVATPIALRYPMIQLMMFLTILIGTSPLYFILITFTGKSTKHNNQNKTIQTNSQPHRRQPSIVGSIAEMNDDQKESKSR